MPSSAAALVAQLAESNLQHLRSHRLIPQDLFLLRSLAHSLLFPVHVTVSFQPLFTHTSCFATAQHRTLGQHSIRRDSNFALLPSAFQSANLNRVWVGRTFLNGRCTDDTSQLTRSIFRQTIMCSRACLPQAGFTPVFFSSLSSVQNALSDTLPPP